LHVLIITIIKARAKRIKWTFNELIYNILAKKVLKIPFMVTSSIKLSSNKNKS